VTAVTPTSQTLNVAGHDNLCERKESYRRALQISATPWHNRAPPAGAMEAQPQRERHPSEENR
jgi:hypothetical protein